MSSGRETTGIQTDRQTGRQQERKKLATRCRGEKLTYERTDGHACSLCKRVRVIRGLNTNQ